MVKIHTRAKRKLKMQGVTGRKRASRPKTFKTKKSAETYAEEKGIKSYELVYLQENKIRIQKK
ncbi:hypothetical protein GOV05_03455 [Candidatus Woesearchaeota archaeon]|nr:hypothetical protein [Candidatus Woesearchaeota archaeon]